MGRRKAEEMEAEKVKMLDALRVHLGVVTSALKDAGICRRTHYYWLESDPEYQAEVAAIEGSALDFAEGKLFEQIREKNTAATIFYLKCKGKKRGYIERSEVQVDGGVGFAEALRRAEKVKEKVKP